MANPHRKIAFVLASTNHGTLITNRFDYCSAAQEPAFGVGHEILETGSFCASEVKLALHILETRRRHFGDGVLALDCGANIGVHAIEWARRMTGWGRVIAFEAQERIFYALAGNIAINNCFNASVVHCALSDTIGDMKIPSPDYLKPASFGSLELVQRPNEEYIGQPISRAEADLVPVRSLTIDSMNFDRVDLIKIDVEGMELAVLEGAANCVAANKPVLLVEALKSDLTKLEDWLSSQGYVVLRSGINFVAIHRSDKCLAHVVQEPSAPSD